MPQKNAPGGSKKKKGRAPKHQNTFAFRHNPKSKKTDKILNSPNVGVCRRCHDKIEWRKKYRKYKPRTQLGKCNLCSMKKIKAAYHTICTDCAGGDKAIADMEKRRGGTNSIDIVSTPSEKGAAETPADGEEPITANDDDNDATVSTTSVDQAAVRRARRRLRVCAMCASEPALSKYSYGDGEDEDLIEDIHLLEDKIEDGVNDDGKKLTLREIKSMERKIEKLQLEMKERRKARESKDDEEENDDGEDGSDGDDGQEVDSVEFDKAAEEQDDDDDDDANDPFLQAIGGKDKLLVGEEYQKMLLARGQHS